MRRESRSDAIAATKLGVGMEHQMSQTRTIDERLEEKLRDVSERRRIRFAVENSVDRAAALYIAKRFMDGVPFSPDGQYRICRDRPSPR